MALHVINRNKTKCQDIGNESLPKDKLNKNSKNKHLKKQPSSSSKNDDHGRIPQRHSLISWSILLRKITISVSLMLLIYLYHSNRLNNKNEMMSTMASCQDNLMGSPLGLEMECPQDYLDDQSKFGSECVPTKCGRFVSDSIVDDKESLEMRLMAEIIFSKIQTPGGVAIFDITTGALSNGTQFVNLYKLIKHKHIEQDLIRSKSLSVFQSIKNKIINSISLNFGASPEEIHLTSPAFFTRIDSTKQHKTLNDQYWHPHVDKETYDGFIYTSLLYLSSYNEEFFGGRFIFLDDNRNITVEPKFGRVLFFTSGSENKHMVEKLSAGTRFALTIPFTCDPKKAARIPKL